VQNLAFMTGERSLLARLEARDNVEIIYSMVVDELLGESAINGVRIKNPETNESRTLEVDGIFVAIGQIPENEPFAALEKLNDWGYFDSAEDCCTKTPGLYVAGDCRSKRIRQVVTASADGAVAAMAACNYLDINF
jgi:thioredoxin reductase (NADPH)